MKVAILIFLFLSSTRGSATCLPDSLVQKLEMDHFEMANLEHAAQNFENTLMPSLPRDYELVIQFQALSPRINAEITKSDQEVIIQVMGGMLGHPKLNENSFKLLLCHELGHFLGGSPFKARGGWSSTEGQADYYSGQSCVHQLGMDEQTFLQASIDLTSIYAQVMREPAPQIDQCDNGRVLRTNFGYPSVQCRLDTIIAGWKEEVRPACWFHP